MRFKAISTQKLQLEDFFFFPFFIVFGNIAALRNESLRTQRPLSFPQELIPEKLTTRNLVLT